MANQKIKITLTDARPCTICTDNWPVIASSSDKTFDNQYEFQANRISNWWLKVRQHKDGRAFVYGCYDYSTNWQGEKGIELRGGVRLEKGADLIAAIREVAADLEGQVSVDGDEGYFPRLARECIADLPAEDLDGEECAE